MEIINPVVDELAQLLVAHGVEYRIITSNVSRLTILINRKFSDIFSQLMKSNKYKKLYHPYGKSYHYNFLYLMEEFQLFYKKKMLIEIFFELPCMSLMPYTWIPLDRTIQGSIWVEKKRYSELYYLDDINSYIFKLTWSVFMKRKFDKTDITFFQENKSLLDTERMIKGLQLIFFKYTMQMIQELKTDMYRTIIHNYVTFCDY